MKNSSSPARSFSLIGGSLRGGEKSIAGNQYGIMKKRYARLREGEMKVFQVRRTRNNQWRLLIAKRLV